MKTGRRGGVRNRNNRVAEWFNRRVCNGKNVEIRVLESVHDLTHNPFGTRP